MSFLQAVERYGKIDVENRKWPNESLWMETVWLPEDLIFPNWLNWVTGKPVTKIYCNKDMAPSLLAALSNLKERNLSHELKTFNGVYNIRFVRGYASRLSAHCYGLAIDLNAADNPLGGPVRFSPEFAQCFIDAGFSWGGNFSRVDAQHFSWAWE